MPIERIKIATPPAVGEWREAVNEAIAIAGSQLALSIAIGVSQSKINWLVHKAKMIPAELAAPIADVTGMDRARFRPDLWGGPDA